MNSKRYIILRYGEINLKGKNRSFFERVLLSNIKKKLKNENAKIFRLRNRVIIEVNKEDTEHITTKFLKMPGIENLSIGVKVDTDYEKIKELALELFDTTKPKFRVSTKRSYKGFEYTSQDTSKMIGGEILKANDGLEGMHVSLKEYDQEITIEILEHDTFIFHETLTAMGGLPVGSSGRGIVLLSGGIDSPVAAIEAMKRGIKVDCAHFYTPPYTSEKALEKVGRLVKILKEYDEDIKLFNFNITDIQLEIKKKCKDSYGLILMRRMMFRKVNEMCLENDYKMIITGESIGQVASQTIENLSLVNMISLVPIIRPLIAHNKNEIITKAKKYGTYETSIEPFEDACSVFAPQKPQTKGKLEEVLIEEEKIEYEEFLKQIIVNKYEEKIKENKIDRFL